MGRVALAWVVVVVGCGDEEAAVSADAEVETASDARGDSGVGPEVETRSELEDAVEDPCPIAVIEVAQGTEVEPLTRLHLIGSQSRSPAGPIVKWEWRVEPPEGAAGVFMPTASTPDPVFEVNVIGRYRFTLEVTDHLGTRSCMPTTLEVNVTSRAALVVELTWSTPGDPDETDDGPTAGADLDLSVRDPDGVELALTRGDDDGAGPELVTVAEPRPGCHRVSARYVDDHGFGTSHATVRIFYSGVLAFVDDAVLAVDDTWSVADVCWPEVGAPGPPTRVD